MGISGSDHAGESNHGSPSHSVISDRGGYATSPQGTAASICARNKATLSSCHRNLDMPSIQIERPNNSNRDRHVADNIFTAGAHHFLVVIVLVRQLLQGTLQLAVLPVNLSTNPHPSTWITKCLLKVRSLNLLLLNQLYYLRIHKLISSVGGGFHDGQTFIKAARHLLEALRLFGLSRFFHLGDSGLHGGILVLLVHVHLRPGRLAAAVTLSKSHAHPVVCCGGGETVARLPTGQPSLQRARHTPLERGRHTSCRESRQADAFIWGGNLVSSLVLFFSLFVATLHPEW